MAKEGILIPIIFWNLISAVPSLFLVIVGESRYFYEKIQLVALGILPPLAFLMYSIILRLKRKRFLTKGNKCPGKIIECDSEAGRPCTYYLYIQFKYQDKRKVIKTKAYITSPNSVLTSDKCIVFELNGKFYPALFDYTWKWKVKKANIKINPFVNLRKSKRIPK